jgi:hypothetical protein
MPTLRRSAAGPLRISGLSSAVKRRYSVASTALLGLLLFEIEIGIGIDFLRFGSVRNGIFRDAVAPSSQATQHRGHSIQLRLTHQTFFLTSEVRGGGGGVFLYGIYRVFRIAVEVITMFEARTSTPTILTILLILSKKNDATLL